MSQNIQNIHIHIKVMCAVSPFLQFVIIYIIFQKCDYIYIFRSQKARSFSTLMGSRTLCTKFQSHLSMSVLTPSLLALTQCINTQAFDGLRSVQLCEQRPNVCEGATVPKYDLRKHDY